MVILKGEHERVHLFFAKNAMPEKPDLTALSSIISTIVEEQGFEVWGVEWTQSQGSPILRVFIDGESGVNMAALTSITRLLSPVFDVEEPISGSYRLEVSSPGLERPLFTLEQFRKYVGERVKIRLKTPLSKGRRKLSGRLDVSESGEIIVETESHRFVVPFENVRKANLVYEF